MPYLVDTDVLIDVAKGKDGAAEFLDSLDEPWSLCVITAMELAVGARDAGDVRRIDEMVAAFDMVPLTPAVGTTAYGLVKRFSKSHGLRVFDALIAATTIETGRILVTRNEKHFRMIDGLELKIPHY